MNKEHKRRTPVFTSAEEPVVETVEDFEGIVDAPVAPLPSQKAENTLPNGWNVISEDQHTGKTFLVTHDLESEGVRAFWRKTRVLSHYKWVMHGKWSDSLTRADVIPDPAYYKDA